MLFFVMLGGVGASLILGWIIMSSKLKDTHQSALLWVLWGPVAIGGAVAGALVARALGLGD